MAIWMEKARGRVQRVGDGTLPIPHPRRKAPTRRIPPSTMELRPQSHPPLRQTPPARLPLHTSPRRTDQHRSTAATATVGATVVSAAPTVLLVALAECPLQAELAELALDADADLAIATMATRKTIHLQVYPRRRRPARQDTIPLQRRQSPKLPSRSSAGQRASREWSITIVKQRTKRGLGISPRTISVCLRE